MTSSPEEDAVGAAAAAGAAAAGAVESLCANAAVQQKMLPSATEQKTDFLIMLSG
jgi:hypothetical protein